MSPHVVRVVVVVVVDWDACCCRRAEVVADQACWASFLELLECLVFDYLPLSCLQLLPAVGRVAVGTTRRCCSAPQSGAGVPMKTNVIAFQSVRGTVSAYLGRVSAARMRYLRVLRASRLPSCVLTLQPCEGFYVTPARGSSVGRRLETSHGAWIRSAAAVAGVD